MINFEDTHFRGMKFSNKQLEQYFQAALGDLKIAKEYHDPEIVFRFSYDALIKLGIYLIAQFGYRVRSAVGHHAKILEKIGQILNDQNIFDIGDKMRQKRNTNFYDGGILITQKDSQEYLQFIEGVFSLAKKDKTLF